MTALPLRPGHRVLDVACGDGTYMAWMAPHVRQVVGVDISFDYIQYARYEDDHPLVTSVTFDDATREFLHHYLQGLQRRVKPFLTTEQRRELE